jgi:hypothetical protein
MVGFPPKDTMKLDRKLNLVIELEREGVPAFIHATPLDAMVFKRYYKPIARAYGAMFAEGYTVYGSPRIASFLLEDAARDMRMWEGPDGVEGGLLPEIRRGANLITASPTGYTTIPLENAISAKLISDDEMAEVENILVFFILASAMSKRSDLTVMLEITSAIWKTQSTLLNSTEFANSLSTSTATENTGEKAIPSPIPY